jgi:8-oxo-dGTP diphosphatase
MDEEGPAARRTDRTYPARPWIGVGVVIVRVGRVLLIRRGKEPGRGLWEAPAGMVDAGEPLRAAAAREAKEETGLDVVVGDVCHVTEFIDRDAEGHARYHNVIVWHWAEAPDGEPACADDAMDARWVALDGLAELPLTTHMRSVLEVLGQRQSAASA